jgi:putative multiple sugar transport system ATP-binding protein
MPELLGMCDRIMVMNKGSFVGEVTRAEASQERIMQMIMAAETGATQQGAGGQAA